jgi:hypothetical protein
MLAAAGHPRYVTVAKPAEADVIIMVESCEFKNWRYLTVLAADPDFRERPSDCFTLNYDFAASGILPGCYSGLPAERFDRRRHRATCYLHPLDERVECFFGKSVECKYLVSFRGAASHPVRDGIFSQASAWRELGPITRMARWFDHTDEEKETFFQEITESRFVICPRGLAPSSYRLFEVMQLGRVPIIISDAWVPPDGPAWPAFSIRLAESKLDLIPSLIKERLPEAEEMGRRARREWEKWFSSQRRMVVAAAAIEDLILSRPENYDEHREFHQWRTLPRHWAMGWTIPQRAARRLRKLCMK